MGIEIDALVIKVRDANPELSDADRARIIRWLNDERLHLLNETGTNVEGYYSLTTGDRDLVAGEGAYALPCDFVSLFGEGSVRTLNDQGAYIAHERKDAGFVLAADNQVNELGQPKADPWSSHIYALTDSAITIRPVPEANVTDGFRLLYYRTPGDWVDNPEGGPPSVTENIWDRWREIISIGATLRSGIRYEDDRAELERHYDRRLMPQFRSNFSERDNTPMSWGAPVGAASRASRWAEFGIARKVRKQRWDR